MVEAKSAPASLQVSKSGLTELASTEAELNIPKRQTIGMLLIISTSFLGLWLAGKLWFNYHPDQVRDPKYFSLPQLAADPKNAAFEFVQRYETGDYIPAGDLSLGELHREVLGHLQQCERDMKACDDRVNYSKKEFSGSAALVSQDGDQAVVEMTHQFGAGAPKMTTLEVRRDGAVWKVLSRRAGPAPRRAGASAATGAAVPSGLVPSQTAGVPSGNTEQQAPARDSAPANSAGR